VRVFAASERDAGVRATRRSFTTMIRKAILVLPAAYGDGCPARAPHR
jgi:hypothetical protein